MADERRFRVDVIGTHSAFIPEASLFEALQFARVFGSLPGNRVVITPKE